MQPSSFENEVNSKPRVYHVQVSHILLDHEYLAIYCNKANILYRAVKRRGQESPIEVTLHIFESNVGETITITMVNDWGREYFIVSKEYH